MQTPMEKSHDSDLKHQVARNVEISSHLNRLACAYAALLETRVKKEIVDRIRKKMGR